LIKQSIAFVAHRSFISDLKLTAAICFCHLKFEIDRETYKLMIWQQNFLKLSFKLEKSPH